MVDIQHPAFLQPNPLPFTITMAQDALLQLNALKTGQGWAVEFDCKNNGTDSKPKWSCTLTCKKGGGTYTFYSTDGNNKPEAKRSAAEEAIRSLPPA